MVVHAPDTVSLFLQVPMYILITVAEVLFSISGLDFAYSQVYVYLFDVLSPCVYVFLCKLECIHFFKAPVSMKAVSQAMWLWTTAVGNLIVVIVA